MSAKLRPEGHKRSKSSLALSLLHRDKSKGGPLEDDAHSTAGSEAESDGGSPISSTAPSRRSLSRLRVSRSKKQTLDNTANNANESSDPTPNDDQTKPSTATESLSMGSTVDESVRVFKIFESLRSKDEAAIKHALVDTARNPLNGTSVLHLAIQCADDEVVARILAVSSNGSGYVIDINEQDRDGNAPLHLASKLGRSAVLQALLRVKEINGSVLNYQGQSALDLARTPEIFQTLQLARSMFVDQKIKEVQSLVQTSDYDGLEKLLEDVHMESSVDINTPELCTESATLQSGGTLLHQASRNRDLRLIQLLLLHGADPFRRDRGGRLPQDVTKDDKTKSILKKSPAATAAQRGIQEKAILGSSSSQGRDSVPGGKESREMKGYLKKWTNYTSGYKLRWFVLEDGVLSYYKHQDDAGSACRGAINMRITRLYMDPQDKTRFEIQGKASVKYHLKANHAVEAKRWFWALNNAIQFAKDEAKEEERRSRQNTDHVRQLASNGSGLPKDSSKYDGHSLVAATTIDAALSETNSRVSFQETAGNSRENQAPSISGSGNVDTAGQELSATISNAKHGRDTLINGDVDDEEEYGDDASSHELKSDGKDAFSVTAQSATLQINLLSQVSGALQAEVTKCMQTPISDPTIAKAISTYDSAVHNLHALVGDLLKISRDRDAYWQYRLEKEAEVRRLWEDSMTRIAREQEALENKIGESEDKRKRTKRALREALESPSQPLSRPSSQQDSIKSPSSIQDTDTFKVSRERSGSFRRKSVAIRSAKRRSTFAADISESDSDLDEEFFDAVDAGEVEVGEMPDSLISLPRTETLSANDASIEDLRESKRRELLHSFKGYEDPLRTKLAMDADDRPKISLWGILKSMIGKDMTKMTLPVSFNEPTSLLQRVTEDMEYTDLLDIAADRLDSTERMVYVAAFAASEYASTIGRVAKPFNPLLGETYEYVRPDKGYRFFIEQVSHHPPIGAAWAESAKWDYYGESAVKSKFYGKSFDINPLGTWFLKLRPASGGEELYTWKKVTSSVIGIITGNPTVDNYGPMEIKNWTTGDVCYLNFKPRGWTASSAYQVGGKVTAADGKTKWSIGGRWNDKLYARLTPGFEDSDLQPSKANAMGSNQAFLVWEAHARPTGIPFNLTPFVVNFQNLPDRLRPYLPPTDTRFRPDQVAMEEGKYDLAASEKNRVEEKQRARRREREANGEIHEPRWFHKVKCELTGEEYWDTTGEYWKTREAAGAGKGEWVGVESIF